MHSSGSDPAQSSRRCDDDEPPVAVLDVGSNSIRLVVYRGALRNPAILFNEKVMIGLGRGVSSSGRLSDEAMDAAVAALRRFTILSQRMRVSRLIAVATSAVREAANGHVLIERVQRACGLAIEVIDGEAEARAAAYGVISGIPDADGVVGDLGGGSLELIRVSNGQPRELISLPIGSLRLEEVGRKGPRALREFIRKALARVEWLDAGKGKPFYTVGGSWRALMHLDMHQNGHPLPVMHQYEMDVDAPRRLAEQVGDMPLAALKAVPNMSSARIPALPGAARLLAEIVQRLASSTVIASAFGLREGLLYSALPEAVRAEDPLLASAREEGYRLGRFHGSGERLDAWMAPLFAGESPAARRVRHAAALLADVAWFTHPDFRPQHALDMGLHGNWAGISASERAQIGMALFACYGGEVGAPILMPLGRVAGPQALSDAFTWGLALRLGQRLCGGVTSALEDSALVRDGDSVVLRLHERSAALYAPSVAKRLRALAAAFGLSWRMEVTREALLPAGRAFQFS
jgi:exopolyphosphatase/guanosine-5'-triphosphate,3'-diphosphate pyrophosphatase